jgi:hypothetical protein
MFQRLRSFQHYNGHCFVPYGYDPSLATWSNYIRGEYYAGRLHPAQISQLQSIGFKF